MEEKMTPITVAGLIHALKEQPQDTDVYFSGTVSDTHCFASINAPVTKVTRVGNYLDSEKNILPCTVFRREEI